MQKKLVFSAASWQNSSFSSSFYGKKVIFVVRPVVMTAWHFMILDLGYYLLGLSGALFLCPLRHNLTLFPYSVANPISCRNNFDKNLANFLESAQNPRTFAAVIWILRFSFCINLVFSYLVSNVAYGVRSDASPFAISTPIKNMGYPCHFSISNPCRLMEDGGCPPKVRVRMSRYFAGDTFRWSSLIISQASRLWASFPIYSTKEKDVTVYSAETNAHHGHPKRLIFTPFLTV